MDCLKRKIIEYYMQENNKRDYYIRLRGNEENPEIKCYYQGIEMFNYNQKFEANSSVFVPNSLNVIKKIEEISKVSNEDDFIKEIKKIKPLKNPQNRIIAMEEYGFDLKLKDTIDLDFSDSFVKIEDNEKNMNDKKSLLEENKKKVENYLRKCLDVNDLEFNENNFTKRNKSKKDKQKGWRTSLDVSSFDYEKIYKFRILKYCLNDKLNKLNKSTGYKSPTVDTWFEISNENIKELINNVRVFEKFNNTMKEAINIYNNGKTGVAEEFDNSRTDSEKTYQQFLMNLLQKKEICSLFTLNDIPFEMEYSIYPKNKENKKSDDEKGRLDNILINDNEKTIKLVEIKLNTAVISGSNGIHKHLLDLLNCAKNNKEFKRELLNEIENRFKMLNLVFPESYKNLTHLAEKDFSIEYYIICGWSKDENEELIINKYDSIKDCNILTKKIFYNDEVNASHKKTNSDYIKYKNKLESRYDSEDLKKTVEDYIDALEQLGIKVYIYSADSQYNNKKLLSEKRNYEN